MAEKTLKLSDRDLLRELFEKGPLSPEEFSVVTHVDLNAIETEIENLKQRKLIKKLREIDDEAFYTLSYKGRRKLSDPRF